MAPDDLTLFSSRFKCPANLFTSLSHLCGYSALCTTRHKLPTTHMWYVLIVWKLMVGAEWPYSPGKSSNWPESLPLINSALVGACCLATKLVVKLE